MKLLLKAALLNRKHFSLLFFTVIAMFMLTIGSQMEMFSLGVIAKTGPDLFVLFGKEEKGKLEAVKELSLSDVEAKWDKIAQDPNGIMTQKSANVYMAARGGISIVQKIANFLDDHFHVHTNLSRLAFVLIIVALFKAAALFAHRYFTQIVSI